MFQTPKLPSRRRANHPTTPRQHDPMTAQTTHPNPSTHDPPTTLAHRNRQARKDRFLEALQEYGTLTATCTATNTPRRTVYDWREQDEAFNAACEAWLTAGMEDELVDSLYQRAMNPDDKTGQRAAEFLLKSIHPDRYTERQKIETTQTTTQTVQVIHEVRHALTTQQQTRLQALRGTIDAPSTDDEPPALPVPT